MQVTSHPEIMHSDERLWVDRYKPKKFLDLLGDEVRVHTGPIMPNNPLNQRVNRETLGWVKEWDQCVFGNSMSRRRKRQREGEVSITFHPAMTSQIRTQEDYQDEYHRPREKVDTLLADIFCD
jgi:chromosome transmission fidelity protein 18